ncbi:hypothetical protein BOTBODRAFT_37981 [Botryobasidium botryosum FD-172 SS1]|uniref:Ammonium transporter n=1 Tax=Botryobasidium botryosum (strain FD-172 SS1) TaxID=930990 RepID=A0A067LYT9_BOTB1|nr:hypothetical protein BOTBODRAFT_37981 [Botryobasidium botryosum FD-172 SS1]
MTGLSSRSPVVLTPPLNVNYSTTKHVSALSSNHAKANKYFIPASSRVPVVLVQVRSNIVPVQSAGCNWLRARNVKVDKDASGRARCSLITSSLAADMSIDSVQAVSKRLVDQSSFDRGDVAFILISGALVLYMVPGLAFLYSGLARRKSALSLIWVVAFSNAVVIFQWFFWGYSLAFSSTATNGFIGNLNHIGLKDVLGAASPGSPLIPELLYSFFQLEFACVTVGILMGGVAERGRVMPAMVFAFLWTTLVYCPIAMWAWGVGGWAFKWGVLDYAGGGPVEIASGVGGLAYSWVLGRRRQSELTNFRPHNVSMVVMGTFMLWLGWIGFNAGSAFGANLRAIVAAWNSNISAAMGGITWCLLDFRLEKKYTMVGFCSGTIAGLVAATPSSGFIPPWASVILGIVTGALCNYATKLKHLIYIDDALDLFAEHAVGGMIGLLFNGLFAADYIIALDNVNTAVPGGWIKHHYKQLYIQFAYICAVTAYTFVVTAAIAKFVDVVPGLGLRATEDGEVIGMDDDQIGEFAQDFIEVRRDFLAWTAPPQFGSRNQSQDVDIVHRGHRSSPLSSPEDIHVQNEKTDEAGEEVRHGGAGAGDVVERPRHQQPYPNQRQVPVLPLAPGVLDEREDSLASTRVHDNEKVGERQSDLSSV